MYSGTQHSVLTFSLVWGVGLEDLADGGGMLRVLTIAASACTDI